MALKRTGALALGLVTALSAPAIAYTALVKEWVSDSDQTRIRVEISSQTLEDRNAPAGNYQQSGGSSGILMLTSTNGNDFQMRFRDTSGTERCIGRLNLTSTSDDRAQAVWYVDGTVEGYRCSTAGQTFRMNLNQTF